MPPWFPCRGIPFSSDPPYTNSGRLDLEPYRAPAGNGVFRTELTRFQIFHGRFYIKFDIIKTVCYLRMSFV